MEIIVINIHSMIDVITNSSTEIFMLDTEDDVETVKSFVSQLEKEYPPEYSTSGNGHYAEVEQAEDWEISSAFNIYQTDDELINYLRAKGYAITGPHNTQRFITIKIERGFLNEQVREHINELFNVVYHTTEA